MKKPPLLHQKINRSWDNPGSSGRLVIWAESLPIARDFWLTGTGVGTYQTAMLVYQQSDRGIFFNQAHNQYLQVLVEGGLLLAVPVTVALVEVARLAVRRLALDLTPALWIRLGALGGLVGVAVQSVWETGLRMPANAVLAAVLAAIIVFSSSSPPLERAHVATARV